MEPLGGLHHVTAITGDARGNLNFYTQVLGMRLVKRTVNQDDVSAYHLFYADAAGSPGTDVTFFDWPDTPPHRAGVPEIAPIALRVGGEAAIDFWRGRFAELGVTHGEPERREGRLVLAFKDPEGQRLELVDDGGKPGGRPWPGSPVPAEHQVKGVHGVSISSARPEATVALLTRVMGFRETAERVFEVGPGGPGGEVRLNRPDESGRAQQGRGGVHHVAFRAPDDAAQAEWREAVAAAGLQVTPIIDRFYFKSIYFREPGGVLFEIATDGPGFTADEKASELGGRLALPPFLEPQREEIEAGLAPLA